MCFCVNVRMRVCAPYSAHNCVTAYYFPCLSVCQCDVTVVGWLVGVVLCCLRVYSLRPHRMLQRLPTAESQCQSRERLPMDMIFTDIVGLTQFKRKVKGGYGKFRYTCELYT